MPREDLDVFRKLQNLLITKYSSLNINDFVKDGYFELSSPDVNLRELEMHRVTDEDDMLDELVDELHSRGWNETTSGYMVKSGCKSINLDEVYFSSGENEGYMFSNGMYLDLDNGSEVEDVARSILLKEFGGEYVYIGIQEELLFLDIDVIESILTIDIGHNGDTGVEYYCTLDRLGNSISEAIKGWVDLRNEFPDVRNKTYKKGSLNSNLNLLLRISILNSLICPETGIIKLDADGVEYYKDTKVGWGNLPNSKEICSEVLRNVDYAYILIKDCKIKGNCWKYKNLEIIS